MADKDADPQSTKDFIAKQGVVFSNQITGNKGNGVMRIKTDDSAAIEGVLSDCK